MQWLASKKPATLAGSVCFVLVTSIASFLLASLFHFAYDFFGESKLAACFFPVNESVWEHLKLCFYPQIIVWLLLWFISLKKHHNDQELYAWMFFSTFLCIVTVLFGYYGLHDGFLVKGLWVDLLLLFIGNILGQSVALHLLKYKAFRTCGFIFFFLLIGMAVMFAVTTFYPPDLPVFISSV